MKLQKRLASQILGKSKKKIVFDTSRLEDISKAITKRDVAGLIKDRVIIAKPATGVSRVRAKARQRKKRQGRYKGFGKRKGRQAARTPRKTEWINKIRLQRSILCGLREKNRITHETFRLVYSKSKGGFFRSKRHMLGYLQEKGLVESKQK